MLVIVAMVCAALPDYSRLLGVLGVTASLLLQEVASLLGGPLRRFTSRALSTCMLVADMASSTRWLSYSALSANWWSWSHMQSGPFSTLQVGRDGAMSGSDRLSMKYFLVFRANVRRKFPRTRVCDV